MVNGLQLKLDVSHWPPKWLVLLAALDGTGNLLPRQNSMNIFLRLLQGIWKIRRPFENTMWITHIAWKVRTPFEHFRHIILGVPAMSDIRALAVGQSSGPLPVLDESVLSGKLCPEKLWKWITGVVGVGRTYRRSCLAQLVTSMGASFNHAWVLSALSKPQVWYCFASARWSPAFHSSCNHCGTWSRPPFLGSHKRLSFAFKALSSLVTNPNPEQAERL